MLLRLLNSLRKRASSSPSSLRLTATDVKPEPELSGIGELLDQGLQAWGEGRKTVAQEFFIRAALGAPESHLPHFYLGNCAAENRDFDSAAVHYRAALERLPTDSRIHYNLGVVHLRRADAESAIAQFRRAIALDPEYDDAWSTLLFALHYSDKTNPREIFLEHQRWGEMFQARTPAARPIDISGYENAGRLRIGYVSGDFRRHSVAYFFEPILDHHDRQKVEVYCYDTSNVRDSINLGMRTRADAWRDIYHLGDAETVELVRRDRINVLVDLSGHTGGARLGVFARRAAPVQIAYFGCWDTTGLPTMDFRIVDPLTDPPGIEEFHTERLLYMPRVQSCYRPFDDAIEPFPLSAISAGHITFGSFNDFTKISDTILDCWTNILLALPDARLRIMRVPGKERIERAVSRMVAAGISEHRLEWALDQAVPPPAQLRFAGIDIALDSYPFNGMTTTCECLWMGIPVVSLYGANGLSRAGLTVFNCLNLGELAVSSPGAYVKCAVTLATDLAKLSELRKQLRERMRHSPLCDGAGLTGELETLYREAWQQRSALR